MGPKTERGRAPSFVASDRLASLSDTMFGVAMTLVVTTLLPSIQASRGSVVDALRGMSGELITVVLSFTISAVYWVSQQQRLAMMPSVSPQQTRLHLVFLFLIVLIPITTSLPGLAGNGARPASVTIYSAHLALIAAVSLVLWLEVQRTAEARLQIVRSAMAVAVFGLALVVGLAHPQLAVFIWFAAMASPPLARYLTRRLYGT